MGFSLGLLLLIALPVGIMQGFFGSGGGLILVPALLWAASTQGVDVSIAAHIAIGTSLLTILVTGTLNTFLHHRKNVVRWDIVKSFLPGIIVGALAGSFIASFAKSGLIISAVALHALGAGIYILMTEPKEVKSTFNSKFTHLFAVLIGIISSIVGIGGATLTVPYLLHRGTCALEAVATSAAIGMPIAFISAISFGVFGTGTIGIPSMSVGYLWIPAAVALIIGCTLTNKIGVYFAHKLSKNTIRKTYGIYSVLVGTVMLIKLAT